MSLDMNKEQVNKQIGFAFRNMQPEVAVSNHLKRSGPVSNYGFRPGCRVWQWRTKDNACKPKIAHLGASQILKYLCLCSGTHSVVAHFTISL